MALNKIYTEELEFLNQIIGDRQSEYRAAEWLKSPFEEDDWDCDLGGKNLVRISFGVRLYNGDLLTAPCHYELLETIKCWLCVQTHFDSTGGIPLGKASVRDKISKTLHVIDYLLLNGERMQVAEHGLSAITENDIKGLLLALASSSSIAIGLYEWPNRLASFLKTRIPQVSAETADIYIEQYPFLESNIPAEEDRVLGLTEDEIVKARVWLWANGYYLLKSRYGYRYTSDNTKLISLLYADTLRGQTNKPVIEELQLSPIDYYSREYEPVPVRSNLEDRLSEGKLAIYCSLIRKLGLLTEIKLDVPLSALKVVDSQLIRQAMNLKGAGRYQTLPQQVVLTSLRKAIEFSIEYGDDLIDSYLSLVERAESSGLSCIVYAKSHPIEVMLTPKLKALGVTKWTLEESGERFNARDVYSDPRSYYNNLRNQPGLWELLKVLFGAIQISIGALMARRNGELQDLIAGQCLNNNGTKLLFENRKSGVLDIREIEARPIPEIGVMMIRQLEKLQAGLLKIGTLSNNTNLFSPPLQNSNTLITTLFHSRLYESTDLFCDYIETPLNENGRRYYIRQHQLRRFFAMLFFWSRSFGGMDTLRWFLGHTDVEHLYHYITESTPGEVLRSVKAHYGGELVKNNDLDGTELSDLLEKHFGTREFSVLDNDELDEYIEELMIEGLVEIEPKFFDTPDGKDYRVAIKVSYERLQNEN